VRRAASPVVLAGRFLHVIRRENKSRFQEEAT
jgi:hypothetical protein